MKIIYIVFGLVSLIFAACKTVKNDSIGKNDEGICKSIVKDTTGIYGKSDSFLLVSAELKGKCLEIEVEYSGGCGDTEWTLVWTGMLMKSLPPKANIFLHLKSNDSCRELIRKKVSFDIGSIYNGEVVLLLKDFRGVLTYKPE